MIECLSLEVIEVNTIEKSKKDENPNGSGCISDYYRADDIHDSRYLRHFGLCISPRMNMKLGFLDKMQKTI